MVGVEHSLKISAPQLLRFGIDSVLKILNERMTYSVNDEGVYRSAPATPGLLKTTNAYKVHQSQSFLFCLMCVL